MEIKPVTFKEASNFINLHHRHHNATVGCKFCVGLYDNAKLIGCAVCGRPVSRYYDNGEMCEINRVCVLDGYKNGRSMLYGACCRIAKNMGYKKIITYTLQSESGVSLRASNFVCEGSAGGEIWSGNRCRDNGVPREKKIRWKRDLMKQITNQSAEESESK